MTLIAAWKTPHKEGTYDKRGIRVIADAMLSNGRHPITREWAKIHVLRPRVQVPHSSWDDDSFEGFHHWGEHLYKRFGLFFAGSMLPFSFVKDRVRDVVENLGLRPIYTNGDRGEYLRTDIVRNESAKKYGVNESIYGGHYQPPPLADLALVAKIVAEEFQQFYASQPGGAFVLAPMQESHGSIEYNTCIGVAGYCDATKQFRIFQLNPEEEIGENGKVKDVPNIRISEVADGDLLLFGSLDHQDAIRAKIELEQAALAETADEGDRQTLARQKVIEAEISSCKIPGVGGAITRAEVNSEYGFQVVMHPWHPAEKVDFSRLHGLV